VGSSTTITGGQQQQLFDPFKSQSIQTEERGQLSHHGSLSRDGYPLTNIRPNLASNFTKYVIYKTNGSG